MGPAVSWFAWGVGYRPQNETGDWTPLIAILLALLISRFVVGLRLTPVTGAFAVFFGAFWAYSAQRWGHSPAAVGAFLVILAGLSVARRIERKPHS